MRLHAGSAPLLFFPASAGQLAAFEIARRRNAAASCVGLSAWPLLRHLCAIVGISDEMDDTIAQWQALVSSGRAVAGSVCSEQHIHTLCGRGGTSVLPSLLPPRPPLPPPPLPPPPGCEPLFRMTLPHSLHRTGSRGGCMAAKVWRGGAEGRLPTRLPPPSPDPNCCRLLRFYDSIPNNQCF